MLFIFHWMGLNAINMVISQFDLASLKSISDEQFKLLNVNNKHHVRPDRKSLNFIFSVWKRTD